MVYAGELGGEVDISAGNIITMVTVLLGVGVGWGVVQQQLREHGKRLDEHDRQAYETNECMLEIKLQLAGIARDIVHIRERIDKDPR